MDHDMTNIRLATQDDAAAVAAIYAPYCEGSAVSFEEVAPSTDEMARRIARIVAHWPWLVLEVDGGVVGYAYVSPHNERAAYRWSVSSAVYVSASHHKRGMGRALYETLFELLRHLGYYQVSAGITLPNPASVALHEAVGFKLGSWRDVAWYQTALHSRGDPRGSHNRVEPQTGPLEPRSIQALVGTAEWHDAVTRGLARYVDRT
jgi:L-amino acid N-acyltransferase YncA